MHTNKSKNIPSIRYKYYKCANIMPYKVHATGLITKVYEEQRLCFNPLHKTTLLPPTNCSSHSSETGVLSGPACSM